MPFWCGTHNSFWLKAIDYNPTTGFSFGGLLACAVAASVWDTPYIGSDLLKEKLTCITFGQPHVSVEVTARLAMMRPEMAATLHAIYTQDDVVPRLMGLLDESWEARAKLEESSSQVGGAPPQLTGALAIVSFNKAKNVQITKLCSFSLFETTPQQHC